MFTGSSVAGALVAAVPLLVAAASPLLPALLLFPQAVNSAEVTNIRDNSMVILFLITGDPPYLMISLTTLIIENTLYNRKVKIHLQ
ncbi:hypothetical protein D3C73_1003180 [compost metagenome]